jgi:hypothetical protein
MWLDSADKFYWFDPYEIDKKNEQNTKGGVTMLNFSIRIGHKLEW